jgi:hypothetical protein
MFNFIAGVVLGIVVANIGFTGIAKEMDKAVKQLSTVNVSVGESK